MEAIGAALGGGASRSPPLEPDNDAYTPATMAIHCSVIDDIKIYGK